MELHLTPRLKRGQAACERYVECLPASPEQRRALLDDATRAGGGDAQATMHALQARLARADAGTAAAARPAHPRRTRLSTTTAMARSGSALPWRTARPATLPARRQVPCCSGAPTVPCASIPGRVRSAAPWCPSLGRRTCWATGCATGAPPERPPAGTGGMGYAARRPGCPGHGTRPAPTGAGCCWRWCWRRPGSPPISWRMCCPIRAGPARGRHPDIVHGAVRLGVRRLLDGDDGLRCWPRAATAT